jgi:2-desacetyl-2-hydroxyethyl bacteriochlorophyllide A dehydrogenase
VTRAKTLYFIAPRQIEIREMDLPALKKDEVLVETICSAISPGTELLAYRGQFPKNIPVDDSFPGMEGAFHYPLAYGYACVGRVVEIGQSVNREWIGKLVFAFQPHTSHFLAKPDSIFTIPPALAPQTAAFLPNMETAVNLVQDGAPLLGERVLVLGQGVIGLLVSALLREFPLESLLTADFFPLRRNASRNLGVTSCVDASSAGLEAALRSYLPSGADLTFEVSGSPLALDTAIQNTAFSGRIVVGSWYGEKKAAIDLGGRFHRSRIQLISSQVSTISPELSARWDKARRFEVAWAALARIQPEKWITQRFPLEKADEAYRLLDENPQETIQILLSY